MEMGKGGGSSSSHADLEPKTAEQLALENKFYGVANGMFDGYMTGNFTGGGTGGKSGTGTGGKSGTAGYTPTSYTNPTPVYTYNENTGQPTGVSYEKTDGHAEIQTSAAQAGNGGSDRGYQTVNNSFGNGWVYNPSTQTSYNMGATSTGGKGSGATGGKGATDEGFAKQLQGAYDMQNAANDRYNSMIASGQNAFDKQTNMIDQAASAGDYAKQLAMGAYGNAGSQSQGWYDSGRGALDQAMGMIRQGEENANLAKDTNAWYDQYAQGNLNNANELLATGNIPTALEDRYMESINRGLKTGMGSMLNDLAGRGVINSSMGTSGISRLGQQAADAFNDNYLNTFNSVLGGYQNNATVAGQTGSALADVYGNISNQLNSGANTANAIGQSYIGAGDSVFDNYKGLGDSYQAAGSQNVADGLALANAYGGQHAGAMADAQMALDNQQQYWDNAMGPLNWVQDFLSQMQASRGTQTTVVDQGKK
jgi:hypothetical protein